MLSDLRQRICDMALSKNNYHFLYLKDQGISIVIRFRLIVESEKEFVSGLRQYLRR